MFTLQRKSTTFDFTSTGPTWRGTMGRLAMKRRRSLREVRILVKIIVALLESFMNPRLILHIGANKTGSSAIQTFLRLNWKLLRSIGYFVPDRNLGASEDVTGDHGICLQEYFNRSDHAALDAPIKILLRNDAKTIVISAENLSNGQNFLLFEKLVRGVDCRVVLYIRRQDDFITSSWHQWNSKIEPDFNAWLILALQRLGHWQRCIAGWESVVGAGNVIPRIFQRSDLVRGDVVDDFISLLTFDNPFPEFARPVSLINPSYSDVITSIVSGSKFLFANEHDNKFYDMVHKLTGDAYVGKRKVSLLSPAQREKIIEYYRPQNEIVCGKYFPGRTPLFEPIDHSKYEYLTSAELMKRQLEFLASLVYAMYSRGAMGR